MPDIPTTEPASLRAGDTAAWTITLDDYPASAGWALSYALVRAGKQITFNASASGADHAVSVAASTTAGWSAGKYDWIARASKAGQVFTVRSGTMEVMPNLAAATGGVDARSHARRMLAAIESWLENRDPGVSEYEISGRRMKYIPTAELVKMRNRYRLEVQAEESAARLAAGEGFGRRIQIRI